MCVNVRSLLPGPIVVPLHAGDGCPPFQWSQHHEFQTWNPSRRRSRGFEPALDSRRRVWVEWRGIRALGRCQRWRRKLLLFDVNGVEATAACGTSTCVAGNVTRAARPRRFERPVKRVRTTRPPPAERRPTAVRPRVPPQRPPRRMRASGPTAPSRVAIAALVTRRSA